MFSDPEVPTPGMRQLDAPVVRGLVSRRALGDATGENRATSQPHQSTGDQAQDVKMEEETSHTSKCSALTEKLCGVCGYASLNGIGVRGGRISAVMRMTLDRLVSEPRTPP